ncbi:flavin-containing monooxygenase [Chryseolinea lacunae]|uniref:NAD(P)/FAD-dependent oxidoreductase n=1 Tax=Chryseolinea lacunae TaxID=2801331 RepID=A0ABS1KPN3_9BACT|nr:NAD(P)/FAD-dependent oxidoreductase [Chryseolinea lacunae]MBL0741414.1 NAD(P)/FAD-dependent oxidoreductase [Chryseolinea lacunae]
MLKETQVLIIGASISGMASAASLKKRGIAYNIIEKQQHTAPTWKNHYDRLHLHTSKKLSGLPYKSFDKSVPLYPSRQQVVDYLADYQKEFDINPDFNTEALSVKKHDHHWLTETSGHTYKSKYVIVATGPFGKPKPVQFKGMETFPGKILHSYGYKTGKDFKGQKVLVVGFGNSACEIAIDLFEQGATPSMSVRSAVNVVPRDIFGIPILQLALLMNFIPAKLADKMNAPLIRLLVGDITGLGLKKLPYGPLEQIEKHGSVPLLDIGTIAHIRKGHIAIRSNIDHIQHNTVHFQDGSHDNFDAIVAGIGYYRDYAEIIEVDHTRFLDLNVSVDKQKHFGKDGLYFCGFWISPTGQIREIARDAQKIARDISQKITSNP